MPVARITMRKIKDILRLKLDAKCHAADSYIDWPLWAQFCRFSLKKVNNEWWLCVIIIGCFQIIQSVM